MFLHLILHMITVQQLLLVLYGRVPSQKYSTVCSEIVGVWCGLAVVFCALIWSRSTKKGRRLRKGCDGGKESGLLCLAKPTSSDLPSFTNTVAYSKTLSSSFSSWGDWMSQVPFLCHWLGFVVFLSCLLYIPNTFKWWNGLWTGFSYLSTGFAQVETYLKPMVWGL